MMCLCDSHDYVININIVRIFEELLKFDCLSKEFEIKYIRRINF